MVVYSMMGTVKGLSVVQNLPGRDHPARPPGMPCLRPNVIPISSDSALSPQPLTPNIDCYDHPVRPRGKPIFRHPDEYWTLCASPRSPFTSPCTSTSPARPTRPPTPSPPTKRRKPPTPPAPTTRRKKPPTPPAPPERRKPPTPPDRHLPGLVYGEDGSVWSGEMHLQPSPHWNQNLDTEATTEPSRAAPAHWSVKLEPDATTEPSRSAPANWSVKLEPDDTTEPLRAASVGIGNIENIARVVGRERTRKRRG
jgi:hypothetical protein